MRRSGRFPLPDEYRKLIDSPVADMKNTGGPWGGAIIAGLVLKEFTADVPWAHLDVAGPRQVRQEGALHIGGEAPGSGCGPWWSSPRGWRAASLPGRRSTPPIQSWPDGHTGWKVEGWRPGFCG